METKIKEIEARALADIENAVDLKSLEAVKNEYLSRNSEFTNLKKGMKDLSPEQKPIIGALINKVSATLNDLIESKKDIFYKKELNEKLLKEKIDVTLDGEYVPPPRVYMKTAGTSKERICLDRMRQRPE